MSVAYLRHVMGQSRDMASLRDLRDAAHRVGLDAACYEVSDVAALPKDMLPAIVHLTRDGGHFVGIDRRIGRYGRVADPARSLAWMNLGKLETSGRFMVVGPGVGVPDTGVRTGRQRIIDATRGIRPRLVAVLVLSLLTTALGLALSQILRFMVDGVALAGDAASLTRIITLAIAAALASGVLGLINAVVIFEGAVTLDRSLGLGYVNHILGMPTAFFRRYSAGDLVSRFSDVGDLRNLVQTGLVSAVLSVATFIGGSLLMYAQNPSLFRIAVSLVAAGALVSWIAGRRMRGMQWALAALNAKMSHSLIEGVEGAGAAKYLGVEDFVGERVRTAFNATIGRSRKLFRYHTILETVLTFWGYVTFVTVIGVGARDVVRGAMSVGDLLSYGVLLPMMSSGLYGVVGLQQDIQRAGVAAERVGELTELNPGGFGGPEALSARPGSRGREVLTARDVEVRRAGRVVCRVSAFRVSDGELVGIRGDNGSGKTTFCQVLAGLDNEWQGQVAFDGVPYTAVQANQLRKRVVYVPESPYIFDDTVLGNVTMGRPLSSIYELETILAITGLGAIVARLPLGLNTPLGSSGVRLSGGESQRLALARALFAFPEVLILDEATRLIDQRSQRRIFADLLALPYVVAVIVVTHDLDLMDSCDQVIELRPA